MGGGRGDGRANQDEAVTEDMRENLRLFLRWHLGLGDAILCNGLVRCLASQFTKVYVTAKPHNFKSVEFQFSDNNSIVVMEADDEKSDLIMKNHQGLVTAIGSFGLEWEPEHWDTCFYHQARVPVEERWKSFHVPYGKQLALSHDPGDRTVFMHSKSSDGSCIPVADIALESKGMIYDASWFRPLDTIFEWCDVIRGASEIYCIDSAFACLVDCMPDLKATKFVLYHKPKSVAPYGPPTLLKKPWEHRYL